MLPAMVMAQTVMPKFEKGDARRHQSEHGFHRQHELHSGNKYVLRNVGTCF